MTSPYRIERDRGTKEYRHQFAKWPLAFPVKVTGEAMHRVDAWRMIRRRAGERGVKVKIGRHTFRATGITAYLEAGGTLEKAFCA